MMDWGKNRALGRRIKHKKYAANLSRQLRRNLCEYMEEFHLGLKSSAIDVLMDTMDWDRGSGSFEIDHQIDGCITRVELKTDMVQYLMTVETRKKHVA